MMTIVEGSLLLFAYNELDVANINQFRFKTHITTGQVPAIKSEARMEYFSQVTYGEYQIL